MRGEGVNKLQKSSDVILGWPHRTLTFFSLFFRGATPFDIDSGIDGAQSRSSSSKDKVWTKIHKQLNRRFGGSTGSLSSTSPISEREASKKASGQIESPTEGKNCRLMIVEEISIVGKILSTFFPESVKR